MREVNPGDMGCINSEMATSVISMTKERQPVLRDDEVDDPDFIASMRYMDTCLVIARLSGLDTRGQTFTGDKSKDDILVFFKGKYGWMKSIELVRA